jgi:hypothetical protein
VNQRGSNCSKFSFRPRVTLESFMLDYSLYQDINEEPGWLSRYNVWLLAGRPRGRSSSPGRGRIFLFPTSSRPVLGPSQPPIQWVLGVLSLGVKRPAREADHSPPTSAEVKKTWISISTPPYAFMAQCLIKHRGNFTFYLTKKSM